MRVIGWDVGGAHLKAALASGGAILDVVQHPAPIWQGLSHLHEALRAVTARLGSADLHAITMTGELADNFASRDEGVATLSALMAGALAPAAAIVYAGRAGWVGAAEAAARVADIASANWHASAALIARHAPNALLADIGSTTTDLIPIRAGRIAARGYSDAERLATGELVYTGLTRSHPMSLGPRAPFAGAWVDLANEYFATMADARRILGDLPDGADQMRQIDGRGQSVPESAARLARMVGRDATDAESWAWRGLAAWFAEAQLRRIHDGAALLLSSGVFAGHAPAIVGAGVGRALAARLAPRLALPFADASDVLALVAHGDAAPAWFGSCLPAVAVAILAPDGSGATGPI